MKPPLRQSLAPFGVSVFTEVNRQAAEHRALNLSQGFPDFDGPESIMEAAAAAMRAGHNQYAPSHGVPALRQAIAGRFARSHGLEPDPEREVTVFSGATEAIFSSIMALIEPGDEVVIFEPFYDSYPASVAMAGGVARYVALEAPHFRIERAALEAAVGPKTKLVIVNSPANPSGRVLTRAELETVADVAREHDLYVLSDEVYGELTFDGRAHLPMATLEGMWPRTLTISSTAKTFSLTGWKIGWALAAPAVSEAVRRSHQFVTFCTATPLQHAMAAALALPDSYYEAFRADYAERRRVLVGHLAAAGFAVTPPEGTYFALADFTPLGYDDDSVFCRELMRRGPVAAIPVSAFYHERRGGRSLVRFAFCKNLGLLAEAGKALERFGQAARQ